MIKAEVDGEVQRPLFVSEFKENGLLFMMGMELGTWNYNKSSNALVLKSEIGEEFNGSYEILNLTEQELEVDKEGARIFYRRVNTKAISQGNKSSGLIGMWEFKDLPHHGGSTFVIFKEPDEFTIIEKEPGHESILNGTWIFDKQGMSLIMIGLRGEDPFHGENRILRIKDKTLELESNGQVLKGKRKEQLAKGIERLSFTEDAFYTEDGDFKYEGEEGKLPWRVRYELKPGLLEVKQLVYLYSNLIEGTEAFESKKLVANVEASMEEEGFNIDFIFHGYDSYNLPDDAEMPENTAYYEPLYPLKGDTYRIVGEEQISTPAGTFNCTVIEALNIEGWRIKLWMINDRMGIYAKIIEEDPDENFGHYSIYELQEIKTAE